MHLFSPDPFFGGYKGSWPQGAPSLLGLGAFHITEMASPLRLTEPRAKNSRAFASFADKLFFLESANFANRRELKGNRNKGLYFWVQRSSTSTLSP
jgi:hypothetical protein